MKIRNIIIICIFLTGLFTLFVYSQITISTKKCDNIYDFEATMYDTENETDHLRALQENIRQESEMSECLETRHKTRLETWFSKVENCETEKER